MFVALFQVIEELRFASQMKGQDGFFASKRTEAQQRNQDFEVMLHAVGLMKVRDSFVGNQLVRGISGGQKRRLTLCKVCLRSCQERGVCVCGVGGGGGLVLRFDAPGCVLRRCASGLSVAVCVCVCVCVRVWGATYR